MLSIWEKTMVIDGGMGTELYECGATEVNTHRLWSTIVTKNSPDIVTKAHTNFISAGADIVITNSYKTSPPLLEDELKCSSTQAENLLLQTINCAVKAREAFSKSTIIAGSVGPYPDRPMSEFYPEYLKRMTVDELAIWHEPRFRILAKSPDVDILA